MEIVPNAIPKDVQLHWECSRDYQDIWVNLCAKPFCSLSLSTILTTDQLSSLQINPFKQNHEKWSNILSESSCKNTTKFLKNVSQFFNIKHEKGETEFRTCKKNQSNQIAARSLSWPTNSEIPLQLFSCKVAQCFKMAFHNNSK